MAEILDYEALLSGYQNSLTTILRGFHAGIPFLQTWVPDEDHAYGILGLAEAAQESGLSEISLQLSEQLLGELDGERMLELLRSVGEPRLEGKLLNVVFHGQAQESKLRPLRAAPVQPRSSQASLAEASRPSPLSQGFELPEEYLAVLRRGDLSLQHQEEPFQQSGLWLERDGLKFGLEVDSENHWTITRARFGGASGDVALLLERFCRVVEGLPLYEAADHGVVLLEAQLRDRSRPRRVAGILLAERLAGGFHQLNRMVRELWAIQHPTPQPVANFFEPPVSSRWRKLSDDGRINCLNESLARHRLASVAAVVRVEGARRVIMGFPEEVTGDQKQSYLMELERHFKETVEATLHVYLEPKMDKNKLRAQKGIQL